MNGNTRSDNMTDVLDRILTGFKAAMDAGCKTQQTWLRAMSGWSAVTVPAGLDDACARRDRMAREWGSFVAATTETASGMLNKSAEAGKAWIDTACETFKADNAVDAAARTGRLWDTGVEAFVTQIDAVGQAQAATMERFARFCGPGADGPAGGKPHAKPSK